VLAKTTAVLGALASVCLSFAACGGSSSPDGIHKGTALTATGGLTADGVFGYPDARVGPTYMFALPQLINKSKAPVTITGYSINRVSPSAEVTGYFVYAIADTPTHNSIVHTATVGQVDGGFVLSALPNYAHRPRMLAPGQDDNLVAMVRVVLKREQPSMLDGCTIDYQTNGHRYRQTFTCDYSLDDKDGP
jgi:hypothetical protein